jgi:hypothetical protein
MNVAALNRIQAKSPTKANNDKQDKDEETKQGEGGGKDTRKETMMSLGLLLTMMMRRNWRIMLKTKVRKIRRRIRRKRR